MRIMQNPMRHIGLPADVLSDTPLPSVDISRPLELLKRCPKHEATPLIKTQSLGPKFGVGSIYLKDERNRLGLGSFKALGAAYVIANMANSEKCPVSELSLGGTTYVTASAGNHGLSVARGAQIFGANAVVYISQTVPEEFSERLTGCGAAVVRAGRDYAESMSAALQASETNGWTLLSDSSWEGYFDLPRRLMEGYLVLADEVSQQIELPPTHIFLQAGVGGMAGSLAAYFRKIWGSDPVIVVVEPDAAPALFESASQSKPVETGGPVSNMGRLDCKEPSFIGLKGLARDADYFQLISDQDAENAQKMLASENCQTSPSGAAGFAGFVSAKDKLRLGKESRVLAIISETGE